MAAFMKIWFLDTSAFTYFTLFEFDFVDIILDYYSWVKTENSKAHYL